MEIKYCQMADFASWLEDQLKDKKMKPIDLARKAGINPGHLSRILNRERNPGTNTMSSIARALGLTKEAVYRAAGLLPLIKPRDAKREILLHLADQLSDEDYTEVVRYTELRLAIAEEKGKYAARSVPQKAS